MTRKKIAIVLGMLSLIGFLILRWIQRTPTEADARDHPLITSADTPAACARAGLPRLTWHALRHTDGALLHGQETPLKDAQAQLGHSHLTTTLEVYAHASLTAQRETVNLLDMKVFPNVPDKANSSAKNEHGALPTN
jgi:integrase